MFLIGGERKARLRKLSPILEEKVQQAFVFPDGWDDLCLQFHRRRTVILRGAPGTGRTAAAVRLFRYAGTGTVYDLDPGVDLTRLAEWLDVDRTSDDRLDGGAGFLLCQAGDVGSLHGRVLRGLDASLTKADARLVLVVGPEVRLADEELIDYLVDLPEAPGLRHVLDRHLEWRLGERVAEQLLARDDVRSLANDLLSREASCEVAALLALILSQEPNDGVDIARVRERMARRSSDEFDTWFEGLRDVELRSFAIALAALDGLPYEDVARAAENLRERLDPVQRVVLASADPPQPSAPVRDLFRIPRRQTLEALRAGTTDVEVRVPYGWVPAQAVAYTDRSYPRAVLRHAWLDYRIHDILLSWLTQLVDHPSEPVRVQVGTTLGVLSTHSFDHLYHGVLSGWAASDERHHRDAVAYALRVPAGMDRLRPIVQAVVAGWHNEQATPMQQATAARTYGISLAERDVGACLDGLDRLASVDDIRVALAIAHSLSDLLVVDADAIGPTILAAMVRWLNSPKKVAAAHFVFLVVANILVTDIEPSNGGGPATWPTLLHLAVRSRDARDRLMHLWCAVLNDGTFHDDAEYVITNWARFAEADGPVLHSFARLVRSIATADPRSREILLRRAAIWRDPDNLQPLFKAASAVDAVLA